MSDNEAAKRSSAKVNEWVSRALAASPPHDNEAPEVIQADRQAAWEFARFHCLPESQMRRRWFDGYYDNAPEGAAIQAFARHRLAFASPAEPAPGAGGDLSTMKEALRRWHRDSCYPDASDFELDLGLNALLIAGMPSPSLPAGREAIAGERQITLHLSLRDDGGLRVYSDDVSGLILSHSDPAAVCADIWPALSTILAIGPSVAGSGVSREVDMSLRAALLSSHTLATSLSPEPIAAGEDAGYFTVGPQFSPPSEKGEMK